MDKPTLRTGAGPYSTRQYVYLLLFLILLMAVITTGFIYWQSNKFNKIEMLANEYHLSTILNSVQIKEEGQHIQSRAYKMLAAGKLSTRWIYGGHFNLNTSFFLIKKKMDTIKELQRRYNHQEYANTLKNADDLLSRLLVVKENVAFAVAGDVRELSEMFHQLNTFVDQLQRLHTIAYEYSMSVLLLKKPQIPRNIFIFLSSLGIIGFLLIGKILNLIRLAEEELDKYRRHLQEQVEERTNELTEANEKLKQEIIEHRLAEEEKNKIQSQLQRAQKLEAVGTLAGGVAHDFNNLLTTIIGYSELISMEEDLTDTTKEGVQEIKKSADRAAALTQQLLAFSRKQIMQPRQIDLNELIKNLNKMLTGMIHENITFVSKLDSQIRKIEMDPVQIEQIIMNLAVNARDAMPDGGTFTIETQNVHLDESYRQDHPEVIPGDYVLLAVNDTGHGMDEETLEHIFDPFYTTKEVGKGTGLGLSTVYGIVKQSGGFIWVYSEPEHGTTFKIYLPAIEETEKKQETLPERQDILSGDESILLVEDEESLRKMAKMALEGWGYSVIEAANGNDALSVIEKAEHSKFDCLVTDVIMPQMGGKELSDKLLKKYPKLKILFVSGYSKNTIAHHGVIDEGVSFLQKPFTPQELAQKIRKLLDRD